MKDKQVIELYYRLESIETIDFKSPLPIKGETTPFCYSLDNGKLTIKLKQHCSSVEDAHHIVGDFLRSWEIDDAIRNGRKRIKFVFDDVKIIDPNNPNTKIIYSHGGITVGGGSGKVKSVYPCYPNPPNLFKISPDVITLWQRYERYLENHEPLQSMAYSCLTFLESHAGAKKGQNKRKKAEEIYKIDYAILDKLGDLTAKGDEKTIRKFQQINRPLNAIEIGWIEATVKTIIRRIGEMNSDAFLPIITMNDLPKL